MFVACWPERAASNDLEVDGCEVSLEEAEAALGVVPRGFFVAISGLPVSSSALPPLSHSPKLMSAVIARLFS